MLVADECRALIHYRAFRNTDAPQLAEVWRSQTAQRGLMQPMSAALFDQLVLAKPYFDREGLIVAVDDDRPVGYVIVDDIDGNAHIEQVSVLPDRQGAGVGRALVDRVRAWAAENRRPAITLTTFSDVPWNRPLYEHLGFTVLADDEIGPELRALRSLESSHGLDPGIRVCMRSRVHE